MDISHIMLGADDIVAAKRFYDAALGALGAAPGREISGGLGYTDGPIPLMIKRPVDGDPASFGNGMTLGFRVAEPAQVDAFHAAGLAAGGTDAGRPGPGDVVPGSYAAYLRDPTGNKLVAWCLTRN